MTGSGIVGVAGVFGSLATLIRMCWDAAAVHPLPNPSAAPMIGVTTGSLNGDRGDDGCKCQSADVSSVISGEPKKDLVVSESPTTTTT